jgi:trehalose 6-phosphate phosphatase
MLSDEVSDASALADEIAGMARPILLVFDCDGVLAPITDHADNARLGDAVGALLTALAAIDGVTVAVLSGRSLEGLEQFAFDDSIVVAGTYGGERRGRPSVPLTAAETSLRAQLDAIASDAAVLAKSNKRRAPRPRS